LLLFRLRLRLSLLFPGVLQSWFSFPEVVTILRQEHPPTLKRGFCVFFTGLSGSGKSTIANALVERLMSVDSRTVRLLDGDIVRQMLSSELGFSEEHRNLNIQRIGSVAIASALRAREGAVAVWSLAQTGSRTCLIALSTC
jgi:sulfate adenylyltransferase